VSTREEINEMLKGLNTRIRVDKVVASRKFRVQDGDYFASFGAVLGSEGDLEINSDPGDLTPAGHMSLKEARVAQLLVSMYADIATRDQALAGGSISEQFYRDAVAALKHRYALRISNLMNGGGSNV